MYAVKYSGQGKKPPLSWGQGGQNKEILLEQHESWDPLVCAFNIRLELLQFGQYVCPHCMPKLFVQS